MRGGDIDGEQAGDGTGDITEHVVARKQRGKYAAGVGEWQRTENSHGGKQKEEHAAEPANEREQIEEERQSHRRAAGREDTGSVEIRLGGVGEWPALGEAGIDRMPREDLLFAVLPAEEDDVVFHLGGEVDEAQIDIFKEAAEFFDFADDLGHTRGGVTEFGMQFDYLLKTHRINLLIVLGEFLNALAETAGIVLQVADQNFEARNQRVGLVGAEELWKVLFCQNWPRILALIPIRD
jgi:hypothetical protein